MTTLAGAASGALVESIDAILPQTQCTKCGYPACRPYAEAIAAGDADINRCPPGGDAGIRRLAALLDRPWRPLDPACGVEQPRRVALIDEARCIGCTLCIQACPVDAIVGAAKRMHTVLTSLCSGCDLCVAPCPVDCIDMVEAEADDAWDEPRMDAARARHRARALRLAHERAAHDAKLARHARAIDARASGVGARAEDEAAARRAVIDAARERVRARRAARESTKPT